MYRMLEKAIDWNIRLSGKNDYFKTEMADMT